MDSEIKTIVEFWQKQLILQLDINPEEWKKRIHDNYQEVITYDYELFCKRYLNRGGADDIKRDIAKLSNWFTTQYQCPIIINGIAGRWQDVVDIFIESWPEKDVSRLENILFATIPIPILNGLATSDSKGNHAVVFNEGLRFIPNILGVYISKLFLIEKNNQLLFVDQLSVREILKRDPQESTKFMSIFVQSAIKPGLINIDPSIRYSLSKEKYRFCITFEMGFKYFLLAHELSHCVNNHCFKTENGGFSFINPDSIISLIEKAKEKYGENYHISYEQIKSFGHYQLLESIADSDAIFVLLKLGKKRPDIIWELYLGAMAFFWYIEMMERTVGIIKNGSDNLTSFKITDNFDLHNLLFRKSHPAPLSRLGYAKKVLFSGYTHKEYQEYSKELRLLEEAYVVLSVVFEELWEDNLSVLTEVSKSQKLKVHQKWEMSIPTKETILGVDYLL